MVRDHHSRFDSKRTWLTISLVTVQVVVTQRHVVVTGKRGKLERTFKHLQLELTTLDEGRRIRVDAWLSTKKVRALGRPVMVATLTIP